MGQDIKGPSIAPPPRASNGYFLLGHVVMAVTGSATLVQALTGLLFQPLGITRIRQARTRIEDQPPDEARYHATTLPVAPSMVLPDRRLMSSAYGGFWNLERDDAGGGLTGSVVDVARLLAMLDVRTNNPVLTAATIGTLFSNAAAHGGHGFDTAVVFNATAGTFYGMKGGDLPESSQNGVRYQTGDLSMVVCWNRSDIAEGGSDGWWYPDYPAVLTIARAQSWPTTDLFPGSGMPSLV